MSYRLELPNGYALSQRATSSGPEFLLVVSPLFEDVVVFASHDLYEVYHKAIETQASDDYKYETAEPVD